MKFTAIIESHGKTATGIEVPEPIVAQLGGGKRPAVSVTINEFTYRTSIAVMGGRYMIGVSADVRSRAGVSAGHSVEVEVVLDLQPREVTVPEDLQKAFDISPAAASRFEKLSFSNQQRFVLPLDQAKTPETRQRRIDKIIADLSADIPQ